MAEGFFGRIREGLARSRERFREGLNVLLDRGPALDDDFWDKLEETLVMADMGPTSASDIVQSLQDKSTRRALPDAYAVVDLLKDEIANSFTEAEEDFFQTQGATVVFVGVNGSGKTTTIGKIAAEEKDDGRHVLICAADTFRAAAIEQLETWAGRAGVEIVKSRRGADPASVCFEAIDRASTAGADLVLIDTAGRQHTSQDLMRELEKVVSVCRKRAGNNVFVCLVIDATTGQNGLFQAREFNRMLDIDGVIITKLDGTAKGGIAVAISHELGLPIMKVGLGEHIEDLRDFDALDFAQNLVGDSLA